MREKRLKRRLVVFLFLLALCSATDYIDSHYSGQCQSITPLNPRPHSVSVLEFGAVGDGKTINTVAFQNAIFYLKSFADKGGAQLYVPAGKWLTGCINLTSHLTLFLEKDATILGSQNYTQWDIVDPLPSYGRGIEVPGRRYRSLINANNLVDVVITGNNGTVDGQGSTWWDLFRNHSLKYSRPHLVELIGSTDIVISNLTFLNAPAWNIRPAYCSNVLVQNITIYSPPESPFTSGIVPVEDFPHLTQNYMTHWLTDSTDHVCIERCNISIGYDAIALKSGWDEYGISYDRPTTIVHIREVHLQSFAGACLAFGSEMSGGISDVLVEHLHLQESFTGIALETARGRGGYMEQILISDVTMKQIQTGIIATGQFNTHPDDCYDPKSLPVVKEITFMDIVGTNITLSGNFTGIDESPFTSICLSNISLTVNSSDPSESWICSHISGFSHNVSPEPCPQLQNPISNSSACFFLLHSTNEVAAS